MHGVEGNILRLSGAAEIVGRQSVQTLWSGYGEIVRYDLAGGKYPSIILKYIDWSLEGKHPRGWNTDISHQRKMQSYGIERNWYLQYAAQTSPSCRVPTLYQTEALDTGLWLLLEDLDAYGFSLRHSPDTVTLAQVKLGLKWLAHFHGKHLGTSPEGLWEKGTYWHLATRPDEWERMRHRALKEAAHAIDRRLTEAQFQTLVHGDAKLANFCFGPDEEIAAVDFQYVGKGCGMKDVAYFLSSCLDERACERHEAALLEYYFKTLEEALPRWVGFQALKAEWTALYPYAWADFYRFLDGWSPGHWKMHRYSKRLTSQVLAELAM